MKIEKIVHSDNKAHGTSDSDESNDYKILKLYLSLPQAPMSYIESAGVHGTARLHRKKWNGKGDFREHNEYRYRYQHPSEPRPDPDEWQKTDGDELEEVTEPSKKKDSFEDEKESEQRDEHRREHYGESSS